jgi:hypothetical protein
MQFCPSDDEKWSLSILPTLLCKMDFALEEMLCNGAIMQSWREFDVGDIEPRNTALCYHLSRTESHPVWRQKLWSSILWQSWGTDRRSVELSLVQTGWVFCRSVKRNNSICLGWWGAGVFQRDSLQIALKNCHSHFNLRNRQSDFWNTYFWLVCHSLETTPHWKVFSTAGLTLNSSWRQREVLIRALTPRLALKVCYC